jgi:hypothetical protein
MLQVRQQGSAQGGRQAEVFGTEARSWLIGVFAHDIGSLEIDSKSLETGIFLSAFSQLWISLATAGVMPRAAQVIASDAISTS